MAAQIALILSVTCALLYGGWLCLHAVSLPRTLVKTASIALLALAACLLGGPWLLVLALALSAIGDAFLAGSPQKWLAPGMAAFLAAHAAYIALFTHFELAPIGIITGPVAGVLLASTGMLITYLWRDLGAMRVPVILYALIIGIMGIQAARLPTDMWPVMLGAGLFILSDGILSIDLFRLSENAPMRRVTSRLVWLFYYGGQALIAYGLLAAM